LSSRPLKNVTDVVDWRLCVGCGACAYICPERKITIVNVWEEGRRPIVAGGDCGACSTCLDVCPGVETRAAPRAAGPSIDEECTARWGPVLEIWEGHAVDPEIRHRGSSGGILTALSAFCLEQREMHGVLHIAQDPGEPLVNRTTMSRSRAELLERTGSRYAPASVCDSLHLVEVAPAPCVIIGQATEMAALRKAEALRPALASNVGIALSFFSAGSPPAAATVALIRKLGLDPERVTGLRYRGNGWPGNFVVSIDGKPQHEKAITYTESWRFLQAYRPLAVHNWPDGTGEWGDISAGDAWHRPRNPDEPGSSLILIRTEKGRRLFEAARQAGYVQAEPATAAMVAQAAMGLLKKKRSIWGRQVALRAFRIPVTRFTGMPLFQLWLQLTFAEKLRSTAGTIRRILQRAYWKRQRPTSAGKGLKTFVTESHLHRH
jgi:coenzyme F420 hydrogenase subunit beta